MKKKEKEEIYSGGNAFGGIKGKEKARMGGVRDRVRERGARRPEWNGARLDECVKSRWCTLIHAQNPIFAS